MLKNLIGIRLMSLLGIGAKSEKRSKIGVVGIVLVYALLILTFAIMFLSIAASLSIAFVPLGLDSVYFAMFNIITFAMIFVLSIFETKSHLFECKDNELLLSMPVRPRDIVLSRALTVIIMNAFEALVINIPAVVMFCVMGGSPLYIPSAIITSLLISLLASALSSGVGYLVAHIASRFKNNSLITIVMYSVFLAAYFILYPMFLDFILGLETDPDAAMGLAEMFGGIIFLGDISLAKPLEMSIFIVISIGFALLAWYIISKNYTKIITTKVSGAKKKYVKKTLERRSPFIALARKEISLFFSESAYVLNGAVGAIFQVLIAVMLLTSGEDISLLLGELEPMLGEGAISVLASALLFGFSAMTSITASAVSIEGNRYWIMKTAPISAYDMIMAKLVPQLLISLPTSLVSSVLVIIALGADIVWWPLIILLPLVGAFVFAMLGLILNIAMPKLQYENAAQVVKQSTPVFIMTLGGMLLAVGFVLLSIFLVVALGVVLAALALSLLAVVLFLVFYLILAGPSRKQLSKI